MARKQDSIEMLRTNRSKRVKLSAKESLKRMSEFGKRKGAFIAAVRKGKNRGVSA